MSAAEQNTVSLVIGGLAYAGWKSVRIEAGIERQARSFTLTVTDVWPGVAQNRPVHAGQSCEIYIGQDRVLTGYVDATPVEYDATSFAVAVQGRSKTADLVDCCPITPPNQWRGLKLEAIAAALAKPYGVEVIAQTNTGAAIPDFTLQQGETVFESIDRMMRLRHVLSTDDELGRLVLIEVGAQRATTALELGKNIANGSAKLDFKDVYTHYICRSQRPTANSESPEDGAEEEGEVDDTPEAEDPTTVVEFAQVVSTSAAKLLGRRRLLVLKSCGQADEGSCQDRVEYERAHRQAKALETTYTMRSWRQENGELWRPNQLVQVVDSRMGFNQTMLIAEVAYIIDEQGLRAEIKVGPPDGYVTKAAKKSKHAGSGADWSDVIPPGR